MSTLWSKKEERYLRERTKTKTQAKVIAHEMGRTPEAVHKKRSVMGLRMKGWTKKNEEILRRRWAEGVLIKLIAYEIGCTFDAVNHKRCRMELPGRRPRRMVNGGAESFVRHVLEDRFGQETTDEEVRAVAGKVARALGSAKYP